MDANDDCLEAKIEEIDGIETFSEKWASFASFQAIDKSPFGALEHTALEHISCFSSMSPAAIGLPATHVHAIYTDDVERCQ